MFRDIFSYLKKYWFAVIITAAVIAGAGMMFLGSDGSDDPGTVFGSGDHGKIKVEIVSDEGICDPYGDGEYYKGSSVMLSTRYFIGWFFEGWFDSQGNLLSRNTTFVFEPSGSCTVYAKASRGYGLNLYKTFGIKEITGRGSYGTDTDATITAAAAAGYSFDGWYDIDNNRVSSSETLVLSDHRDRILIARSTAPDPYAGDGTVCVEKRNGFSDEGTYMVLLNQRTRDVVAVFSGNGGGSVGLAPGLYELDVKGVRTDGVYGMEETTVIVDGPSTNVYTWDFGGETYSLTWELDTSVYEDCVRSSADRWPVSEKDRLSFVDYESPGIRAVAEKLLELSEGMDDLTRANFALKFVQLCTEYQYDHFYNGCREYWKYPVETLFEGRGDCEDTSILYCALVKAMGFDSAMLFYQGEEFKGMCHAAASVALDSCPGGTCFDEDGRCFYFCETTADTLAVGDVWSVYGNRGLVCPVPRGGPERPKSIPPNGSLGMMDRAWDRKILSEPFPG